MKPLALILLAAGALALADSGVYQIPGREPEGPVDGKAVMERWKSETCYVVFAPEALSADEGCRRHPEERCRALNELCRWKANEGKCRGLVYVLCATDLDKQCHNEMVAVDSIPKGLPASHRRFRCRETGEAAPLY